MSPRKDRCRLTGSEPPRPFGSAVEAWFWAMLGYRRHAPGTFGIEAIGAAVRPCDPEDVLRAAEDLRRRGRMSRRQFMVLAVYGRDLSPPDPMRADERTDARLWGEAFERLDPILREKGIVA